MSGDTKSKQGKYVLFKIIIMDANHTGPSPLCIVDIRHLIKRLVPSVEWTDPSIETEAYDSRIVENQGRQVLIP